MQTNGYSKYAKGLSGALAHHQWTRRSIESGAVYKNISEQIWAVFAITWMGHYKLNQRR